MILGAVNLSGNLLTWALFFIEKSIVQATDRRPIAERYRGDAARAKRWYKKNPGRLSGITDRAALTGTVFVLRSSLIFHFETGS